MITDLAKARGFLDLLILLMILVWSEKEQSTKVSLSFARKGTWVVIDRINTCTKGVQEVPTEAMREETESINSSMKCSVIV